MSTTSGHRWLAASVAAVVLGLTFGITGYPLLEPDEGRNAEVAREMAASNDYAVPRLNGLPYPDKPVLYFAVGAAFIEVLGPTEAAARLPSLLFTMATLALVWWFGRRTLGPVGGVVAAVATGAAPLTLAFARTVIFDSALTCFVTLSIVAFYVAAEGPEDGGPPRDPAAHRAWWTSLGWAGLALAVLTKGPIGLALPLMVIVPYLGWRRRWRALWDPVAVLLFVAMLLPWLFIMSRAVPGFLEYALVTETFKRLTTDELHRTGPFWYFIPIVIAGSLPWSLVAAAGWRRGAAARGTTGRRDHRLVFLLLWIVIPLVFFSLSQSKRPHYVLPLIPAVGLLVGLLWSDGRAHGARGAGVGLAACGLVILLAPAIVGALLEVERGVAGAIPRTAWSLGAVCVLAGAAALVAGRRPEAALLALCLPVAAIPFASGDLMRAVGADRSSRDVAAAIARTMTDRTEIVAIETYPLSLPFYLRRPLVVSTADGAELTSNYLVRTYPQWAGIINSPLRPSDWWVDALADCRRPRVFVARSDDDRTRSMLAGRLPLIGSNRKVAAYGPCGASDLAARPRDRPAPVD